MANLSTAEQPKLFVRILSIYHTEEGGFDGAFCIVTGNFTTSNPQLSLLEGCPMWVRLRDNFPFVKALSQIPPRQDGEAKVSQVLEYELDAHQWRVSVARYTDKETGEVGPKQKLRTNTVTGELVPDTFVDGTIKVYVTLNRVVTSAPEWA